ncbi:hypothetical protein FJ546_10525 [Mesorhizobium sp. B2-4-19]|uniref:hypothetical protein n=1 Tax=Mesorhizobium sp. B2-4-19 TaxID=2589930 RepID=UPI001128F6A9|nr:hypothetical protein [Mesorhizobium sp. B2-4-19]TPK65602.1 hypothetical protein FJ546_10525 [Mesorhizobium sp. B2-4-19]
MEITAQATLGANVAVLDFDHARATTVAAEIGGVAVAADVGVAEQVEAALGTACDALGQVPRIVVNCAGIGLAARIVARDGALSSLTRASSCSIPIRPIGTQTRTWTDRPQRIDHLS